MAWNEEVKRLYDNYQGSYGLLNLIEEYKKVVGGDAIPMMNIMGNDKLYNEFNGDECAVYIYCITKKKTWAEVLEYVDNPDVVY